ncbi:unnamed protein product [Zymoseptoria tritici ST99CH_3D7]|uniref:Bifunctional cytochrome P450/NADPH--P450 reductase n=1 Tax=Zymoseptoria tritici (strain ST99CH_3D7) TaxID=1276538 RepID=A0A1X7RZG7_ZYMT9|nr:unnamed protein product [Zymoseptoria tritici ST99CH_3D7]
MTHPIPSPRAYPFIGNLLDIDASNPTASLAHLADVYGPIFKIRVPKERLWATNYAVASELFDEKRFQKAVTGPLEQVRNLTGDGLFTAYQGEPAWQLAHRLLMPAFGPLPIKSMFPEMQDIVNQMVLKWARFGPDREIDVADDFTRLTLDSIAICAMGDRFNSFYHEGQHPFVDAMVGTLSGSFARSRRLPLPSSFYAKEDQAYAKDIATCENLAKELLTNRRANPTDKKDLLNAMINAEDPKTGERLSDPVIIRNMVTFLIAGHETTSGLLSFLFYLLLETPPAYRKLQEEIDTVVGKRTVTVDDMGKLPYVEACLRETLRLYSTAPAFTLTAKGDQIIDEKYLIKDGQHISVLLSKFHRDPEVYGPDVEAFRPERMYKNAFTNLPPNAWKPFGNGSRACIGRPFAWQEAILAVAVLVQTFQFTKADPNYKLEIQTALTIKPKGFFMKAKPRNADFLDTAAQLGQAPKTKVQALGVRGKSDVDKSKLQPLEILYGSNTGTCEALAQALASASPDHGFNPTVRSLDEGVSSAKKNHPMVIFTASYEGQPPDNAGHFVEWVTSSSNAEIKDVPYAVFGVGNREWAATYQRIPKVVDEALAKIGAKRLVDREECDVAADKVFEKCDDWQEFKLWPALRKQFNVDAPQDAGGLKGLDLSLDTQMRSTILRQDTLIGEVTETKLLTSPGAPRKRHIGIRLPSGTQYRAGDYLAVLPVNPPALVKRVLNRFQLPWDAMITIAESNTTSLPKGMPISAHDTLASLVEIESPVSSRVAASVSKSIPDEKAASELEEKLQKGNLTMSLLDLLEQYPEAQISFAQFLASLPPMRIRQYSISSSPLADPSVATLTYSVIDAPNRSGGKQNFVGICTTYMERLSVGDRMHISLKPSRTGFHLPADDHSAIIMACAGTGLAPFRAFVAERAIKKAHGGEVGPALLFYGLNRPEEDDMYRDEFDAWEKEGVVSVRRAYTFKPEESHGTKFVQERLWHDREDVVDLFRQDAKLYLCGAGVVGQGVEGVMTRIRSEMTGENEETAKQWVQDLKGDRFWSDVFS